MATFHQAIGCMLSRLPAMVAVVVTLSPAGATLLVRHVLPFPLILVRAASVAVT